MSAPRFTVLMPTHYRPDAIGYAIRSVLNQSEPDFELLVVGDGAAPGTAEVVLGFDDPRVRWFDLPKAPGYGYANRNIAMGESSGQLIAYAADDDLMLPDALAIAGAAFEDPAVQWSYSQVLWVSTDGVAAPDLTNLDFADERAAFERSNTISGGAITYRVTAFETRQAWPETIMQRADWHIMKSLLARHGLGAMRRIGVPTLLHFTAGQKTNRHSSFPLLEGWLKLADSVQWWPDELRAPVTGLPQAAYFERLANDPAYAGRLCAASADVVNRAALDAVAPRTFERPVEPPPSELAQIEELRAELAAIRRTISWRLTAPLRRVRRLTRPKP